MYLKHQNPLARLQEGHGSYHCVCMGGASATLGAHMSQALPQRDTLRPAYANLPGLNAKCPVTLRCRAVDVLRVAYLAGLLRTGMPIFLASVL